VIGIAGVGDVAVSVTGGGSVSVERTGDLPGETVHTGVGPGRVITPQPVIKKIKINAPTCNRREILLIPQASVITITSLGIIDTCFPLEIPFFFSLYKTNEPRDEIVITKGYITCSNGDVQVRWRIVKEIDLISSLL
jgi:hypothetical protein